MGIAVAATLIKCSTADGLVEMEAGVPLGKIYRVFPETKRTVTLWNVKKQVFHEKEIVDTDSKILTGRKAQ